MAACRSASHLTTLGVRRRSSLSWLQFWLQSAARGEQQAVPGPYQEVPAPTRTADKAVCAPDKSAGMSGVSGLQIQAHLQSATIRRLDLT